MRAHVALPSRAHDVSVILDLLGRQPLDASARGFAYTQPGGRDVVFMTLAFPGNIGGHVHISWLDPHKVRRMTAVGSRKMLLTDGRHGLEVVNIADQVLRRHPFHAPLLWRLEMSFGGGVHRLILSRMLVVSQIPPERDPD